MKKLFPPTFLLAALLPLIAAAQHPLAPAPANTRAYAQVLSSRPVLSRPEVVEAYRDCAAVHGLGPQCEEYAALAAPEHIENYEVTYRYRGRIYRTHMPYDPGDRVPVRPDVQAKQH